MARKEGIITHEEAIADREKALEIGELTKRNFSDLIPHRINQTTVILISTKKDKADQIKRFLERLDRDRLNY
jgi:DNA-binding Lrp family transcriptional regulator